MALLDSLRLNRGFHRVTEQLLFLGWPVVFYSKSNGSVLSSRCVYSFANTIGTTLSADYLIDSHKDMSGDGMTTVIIVRNSTSFAASYGQAS